MPAKVAPNNDILYGWATGEDYWGGPMNENLAFIDTLLHPYIKSMSWSSPPPDAVEGDRYVVAANPTATWAGQQGNLAVMIEGAWKFYEPKKGWRARLESTGTWTWFNGVDWVDEGTGQSSGNPTPGDNPREYHVSATIPYQPKDGELILMLPIIKAMILPKNAAGSQFTMVSASPGYAVFDIQRNGISVGKMIVEQGQYEATFSIPNSVTFAAGDRLSVYAPSASIAGFQDFGFVLKFDILGEQLMALFFDGFEQFDKAENVPSQMRKAGYDAAGSVSTAAGRIAGKAITTYRSSFGRTMAWNGDRFSLGFAAKFTQRGGMCIFPGVQFILDSVNGLPSFLGVTGGSIPTKAKWYYYEFDLDRAARTVTLFINGKQNGQAAMPDTLAGATSVTLSLNAYNLPTSVVDPKAPADNATRVFDDLYMYEGPRLTPVQVTTRFPTKDEGTQQWQVLPDDISHSEAVGKLPTDELDRYILTNKNGASDTFSSSTKLPDNKKVVALGAVGLVRKTDANSGSIDFRVGTRAANVTDISTTWKYQYVTWLANDGDTADTVNNSQMGVTAHIGS